MTLASVEVVNLWLIVDMGKAPTLFPWEHACDRDCHVSGIGGMTSVFRIDDLFDSFMVVTVPFSNLTL